MTSQRAFPITGVLLLLTMASCGDGVEPVAIAVRVDTSSVAPNPHNVISAVVTGLGLGDSARVLYRATGADADSATAFVAFGGDSIRVPVLGLLPQTTYDLRLVAYDGLDSAVGLPLAFTTGTLPVGLPSYVAGGGNPASGYVVFSAGLYGLVIDNTGRVVWYRAFPPNGPGLNFMAEPTGVYVGRPSAAGFLVVDALGDSVRVVACGNGRPTRFHDLLLVPDGSAWLLCDDTRTVDLSAFGGSSTATVTGSVVQHVGADGAALFDWTPFDHFAYDDTDTTSLLGPNVNWTHGNSLDLDTDGHVLVAFRSLNEVTKINTQTGAVVWRMGGRRNQFAFTGSPEPGFDRQHNVRVAGPGRFIILDNTGGPSSRYERYRVDTGAMTAELEQSYASASGVQTLIGGSVQVAGADRWLVSFGTQGRVEEFDGTGSLLWEIVGNPGYVFRAQRISSLYAPGVGAQR